MSGSGSRPTKPVPAPRRGSKLKEPSASDKLKNLKTQFGHFMGGRISSENVCCAYQERRNVTKVGRPTEKRTFRCPRWRRIFLHKSFALRAEQRLETALRWFPKLEKNWTRQLTMSNYCNWKEWVNPLIPIHFFVIWLCKSLSVRI